MPEFRKDIKEINNVDVCDTKVFLSVPIIPARSTSPVLVARLHTSCRTAPTHVQSWQSQ